MSFANGGITLDRISIGLQAVDLTFIVEYRPGLLSGVTVIQGKGYVINEIGWQDEGWATAVDSAGRIVIAGEGDYSWDGPDGQTALHPYSGSDDIVVLKLDASGAYQWHSFFGSSDRDEGWGIAVESTGGLLQPIRSRLVPGR